MAETSIDAFKAKDTRFVVDWLKSKGLHKLCSVFDGAFEQLFGLGRGKFEQKFSKNSNAQGVARGGCLSFDLTGTLLATKMNSTNVESERYSDYFNSIGLLQQLVT